jgi:sec-independent protein translocase protein TatA
VVTNLLTPTHIAILVMVLLLLFGAKRLPETSRALGTSMREFKDAITRPGGDEPVPPNLTGPYDESPDDRTDR